MAGRYIKVSVKCGLCSSYKSFVTYHKRSNKMVCLRCHKFLEQNPTFGYRPFKGWGYHYEPKQKKVK